MSTENNFATQPESSSENIDEGFESRKQEGATIGDQYAERVLSSETLPQPDEAVVDSILAILQEAQGRDSDGLVAHGTNFGNMPPTINEYSLSEQPQPKESILTAIDNFLTTVNEAQEGKTTSDTLKKYKFEKIGTIYKLPQPLAESLFAIAYGEGPTSTKEGYKDMRDKVAALPSNTIDANTFIGLCREQRKGFENANNNDVRQAAVFRLLQRAYPDIVNSPEVKLLNGVWAGSTLDGLQEDLSKVAPSAKTIVEFDQLWEKTKEFLSQKLQVDTDQFLQNKDLQDKITILQGRARKGKIEVSLPMIVSAVKTGLNQYVISKLAKK